MEHEAASAFTFGIENTVEMGTGSPELLRDLMSPETSTSNPDDLEKIVKEVEPKIPSKIVTKPKEVEVTEEEEKPSDQEILKNFLLGDDDEEEEEETDKTVESSEEEQKKVSEKGTDIESSQFTALSKDLFKLGVFSTEEDETEPEIKTGEEFLERFNVEKKKGAMEILGNFLGQFGEDYQAAFDAIYVKGVKPEVYWSIYSNIVNFAELDLSSEENQIKVMRQSLTDQGMEPEDITAEIDRLKTYADLEATATRHHKVLVKKEAAKLQQEEDKSERDLQQKVTMKAQFEKNVNNILQEKLKAKEFDGIPINTKLASELQAFLIEEAWITPSGEKLTSFDKAILDLKKPENHALKVKLALFLKVVEKDPQLTTIQRSGLSKKSDQLFSEITKQQNTKVRGTKQEEPQKSWFSK